MMRLLLLSIFSIATARASEPNCRTSEKGESTVVVCERPADVAQCQRFVQGTPHIGENPNWNDCTWPAMLYKGYAKASGGAVVTLSVSVVPSFLDSRLVDLVLTFKRHGEVFQLVRKDVEVKIDANHIPSAKGEFSLANVDDLDILPTIEMTEKGGKQQMSHSYR